MTYQEWKACLVNDPDILGGTTTFPGSRLAIIHIGGMALAGEPFDTILEDYPYLTKEDIMFACRYVEEGGR
jgi:uncharacterized protein (DUF433 family)